MPTPDEMIRPVKLPSMCLFHNADIDWSWHPNLDFTVCDCVVDGDDLDELRSLVPEPALPTDPEKLALYRQHRTQDRIITWNEKGDWSEEVEPPRFDDSLDLFATGASDLEIFGESYTILLVVPPDVGIAVDYLLKVLPDPAGQIDGFYLLKAWTDYVDRLTFWPVTADSHQLWLEVTAGLEARLNSLPNGPGKDDWDDLNELLLK
jgi:hypothetical protein